MFRHCLERWASAFYCSINTVTWVWCDFTMPVLNLEMGSAQIHTAWTHSYTYNLHHLCPGGFRSFSAWCPRSSISPWLCWIQSADLYPKAERLKVKAGPQGWSWVWLQLQIREIFICTSSSSFSYTLLPPAPICQTEAGCSGEQPSPSTASNLQAQLSFLLGRKQGKVKYLAPINHLTMKNY